MANIFVRSPYIENVNAPGQIGSKIEIYLWNDGTTEPTTPQYTLSKLIPSDTNTLTSYDISPYVREYLSHLEPQAPVVGTFTSLASTQWCNVKVRKYKLVGTTYTTVSIPQYYAFDGYSFYESGANYDHGRFLLEQKEYFYNEDATYAGEVATYLNANEFVRYVDESTTTTITGVTLNVNLSFEVTTLTKTGRYILLPGEYLSFTYTNALGNPDVWVGTVLTCTYNSGTNTTTITPDFLGFPVETDGVSPTTNKVVTTLDSAYYTIPSSKWHTIARISGAKNTLQILSSSYTKLAEWEFTPVCESKYTPVTIDFINKYGAWQREFFFKASKNTLAIESSDYNVMQSSASSYDVLQGQKRTFNANARETISVNSGYVNEDFSSNIKQLIMSERILVDNKPAICKTKSLELMKNINNHMINYSLEFEFAYNTINNVI
ncbi:hypothetical protein UFOVP618_12 [uncultured Caudovirales phage]|uniref:Uncharacterized protein n=1 Tax=uncultured Caudovirales phage TaxID=2100421 RepID=A0A6J5N166_9CAUD|nr:hypothetical protein UFOVP618_12 [uncultured Caudovirales phage]